MLGFISLLAVPIGLGGQCRAIFITGRVRLFANNSARLFLGRGFAFPVYFIGALLHLVPRTSPHVADFRIRAGS